MKVDITNALNDYFRYDILGINGFKNDRLNTSGIVQTDTFFENTDDNFDFVSTKEVEFNKETLYRYPVFKDLMEDFCLPIPPRILCDGIKPGAFVYPEYVFIVCPSKEVD